MPDAYVITKPEEARGVYDTWDECWAALSGKKGVRRYMKVSGRAQAEAVLEGRGVVLEPGLYAFTDGNHRGGIGVVLSRMDEGGHDPVVVEEIATSVTEALRGVAGNGAPEHVATALERVGSALAETAALHVALMRLSEGAEATIVYDFDSVGNWMEGRCRLPQDPLLREVVERCLCLRDERKLRLVFLHQPSHRSDWAGRHDLARLNRRADELATKGAMASAPDP